MRRLLLLLSMLLASCHGSQRGEPIAASVIGVARPASAASSDRGGMGLVRLDREGQVIGGAAVRWAILEDGVDYIFRLDDSGGLTAATAARRLRSALKARDSIAVRALAGEIESVRAVTNTVLEIRLAEPQPDLLPMLAGPEFAIGAPEPLRRGPVQGGGQLLVARAGPEPLPPPVLLRTEPVGRAVARYKLGESQLVLGGTFADLAVARTIEPNRRELRFDPATGLFGFVVRDGASPYAARPLLDALSLALDRDRVVAMIAAPGLAKATTLAGSTLEPSLAERRASAMQFIRQAKASLPPLRVAMPRGPGARMLFALAAQDWSRIGIGARAVPAGAPADIALIDLVAPGGSRAVLACAASDGCDPHDRLALLAPPYIPIAAPVRWSLVARKLDRFEENGLAAHPLDQLR